MSKATATTDYLYLSDLALVVFLSLYYPIERIESDPNSWSRSNFLFAKTPAIEKLIDQYYRGELRIEPQLYFNQIRAVKARLRP